MTNQVFTLRGHTGTIAELAQALNIKETTVRRYLRDDPPKAAAPAPTREMRKEAHVKAEVKRILQKYGAWYTMPFQAGYSQAGVPDFIICIRGIFLAIETKFGDNVPTAHQRRQMREIVAAEGDAWVVTEANIDTLESRLFDFIERRRLL